MKDRDELERMVERMEARHATESKLKGGCLIAFVGLIVAFGLLFGLLYFFACANMPTGCH